MIKKTYGTVELNTGCIRQRGHMRRRALIGILCVVMLSLSGCGQTGIPEEIESSAVAVSKKGQIEVHLIGEFSEPYYDLSGLTLLAMEEADEFNAEKKSEDDSVPVTVEGVEMSGETRVKVSYRFDNWKSYTEFNDDELFYGTVSEAAEKGYISGVVLKSVKDGTLMNEEQLKQEDRMMIITNVPADIYCPGKVTHISDGAALNKDGSVAAAEAEKMVFILLK